MIRFNNKFQKEFSVINIDKLNVFDDGTVVDLKLLVETGIVPKRYIKRSASVINSLMRTSLFLKAFFSVSNIYTTSALPPAFSIFSFADAVNFAALTVSFLVISPSPRIFSPYKSTIQSDSLLGLMSGITGSALQNGALFAIGVTPYITP